MLHAQMLLRSLSALFALSLVAELPAQQPLPPIPIEEAIAAYEKRDRAEPPRKGEILFLGGMLFKAWDPVGQDFPPSLTIVGRGYSDWSMANAVNQRFVVTAFAAFAARHRSAGTR